MKEKYFILPATFLRPLTMNNLKMLEPTYHQLYIKTPSIKNAR